jgi:predicted dehydrogenase
MLRLGIVDFDSSHSIEFTQRFNHAGVDSDQFVEGARVVLGCPGTSEMSPERIPEFREQIRASGVELVERPEEMLGRIDAVLVLSLCGAVHRERVRPFLEARVPAYVDKPFSCSLDDAEAMIALARESQTLLFHSSALWYAEEIEAFHRRERELGTLHGLVSYGPAKRAKENPGLFHYGIHPTSILFALMGVGCESVRATCSAGTDVVTGCWKDGRIATLRGNREGNTAYGFLAFCENGVVNQQVSARFAYRNLCRSIVESFSMNQPDVSHEMNLEMTRFVLAASASEAAGGGAVELSDVC